jgi:hypothetical protein
VHEVDFDARVPALCLRADVEVYVGTSAARKRRPLHLLRLQHPLQVRAELMLRLTHRQPQLRLAA